MQVEEQQPEPPGAAGGDAQPDAAHEKAPVDRDASALGIVKATAALAPRTVATAHAPCIFPPTNAPAQPVVAHADVREAALEGHLEPQHAAIPEACGDRGAEDMRAVLLRRQADTDPGTRQDEAGQIGGDHRAEAVLAEDAVIPRQHAFVRGLPRRVQAAVANACMRFAGMAAFRGEERLLRKVTAHLHHRCAHVCMN